MGCWRASEVSDRGCLCREGEGRGSSVGMPITLPVIKSTAELINVTPRRISIPHEAFVGINKSDDFDIRLTISSARILFV